MGLKPLRRHCGFGKNRVLLFRRTVLVLFLAGCVSTFPFAQKDRSEVKPLDLCLTANVDSAQPRLDYEFLKLALTEGYIGFEVFESDLKENILKKLESAFAVPMSSGSLCQNLGQILDQIQDAHLLASEKGKACRGPENHPREGRVGVSLGEGMPIRRNWHMSWIAVGSLEIPVVSLKSFPRPKDPRWDGFDEAFEKALRSRKVVIDVRGNRGGDDTRAFEIARRLVGPYFQTPQKEKRTKRSLVSRVLFLNKTLLEQTETKSPSPALREEERVRRLALLESDSTEFEVFLFPNNAGPFVEPYEGQVYVLADAACGSTGELFVLALKGAPHVTIVGENTAGLLHFGNPGLVVLPHSKIVVEIPTTYKTFRNVAWLEKIGISPDIKVPSGEDALQKVMQLLLKPPVGGNVRR